MVKQLEQPNIHNNPLPQHNVDGVNMIGTGDVGGSLNHKYLRRIDEYPPRPRSNIMGWEYPKRSKEIEQKLEVIKN